MTTTINKKLQFLINKAIEPLNARLVRLNKATDMELCLTGLVKRGYIPEMVLDVGAAKGDWTRLAMQCWPKAEYFLIEPLEERLSALNTLKNQHSNVKFILSAAGSEPGILKINVTQDLDGSSLLSSGNLSREVPIITIDSLIDEGVIQQPQFVKLDVQGYELKVLEGAKSIINQCEFILLELQFFKFSSQMNLIHESIAWMKEKNFQPYEIVDVLRKPLDQAMGQCDILFIRKDHWLLDNQSWA